ncbi:hypothetical protein MCBG_02941 [Micromonospora sp. M42]|uniref:hypothetical protein n=1 Tax=Micromonospora sp. M42 TaxID=457406 RepID=UPI0003EEE0C2|nr:hypothetical protein [Micromonospora sp. M42]EWM65808.1 hypothetical protein MCBG_02941 [Micromonospora sp. M42]
MPDAGPTAVLPRRPLTVGELLDAAVLLLRDHARVLVPLALVLALAEQAVLHPLRLLVEADPPQWWPADFGDSLPWYWLLLATGPAPRRRSSRCWAARPRAAPARPCWGAVPGRPSCCAAPALAPRCWPPSRSAPSSRSPH